MTDESTGVLVVGGGLVGLSTALFLAWHDVPVTLVERHPGSSPHPRALGYTMRTAELYRSVGVQWPDVRAFRDGFRRARVTSMAGERLEEMPWESGNPPEAEYSPSGRIGLAQDKLEPLLRARAEELGADIRFGTELVSFEQDETGVTGVIHDVAGGTERSIRANYLVAADGHRSPIRERLGIARGGRGYLGTIRSALFGARLEHLRDEYVQFVVEQPDLQAFLVAYGDDRWVMMFVSEDEPTKPEWRQLITGAIGVSDVDFELITTGRWEIRASIADRYSEGRIFLAGDAAHTLPPNRGGYGANTGIQDAHNLAWKLAAVLSGQAGEDLLDSYDAERRPVAWLCHQQLFARNDQQLVDMGPLEDAEIIDDVALCFGYLYRSSAVLGAGPDLPPARRPDEWAGQPGTRAPHVWLDRDGDRVSTIDLSARNWVLLTAGGNWPVEPIPGLALDQVSVEEAALVFGLKPGGGALVRPDGYVAWRSCEAPTDPSTAVTHALTGLLSR
ncbi:FAD-dependent oxidoreductase [Streptomyces sp. NPDC013178]|uniref:FAD-dependent oxidoreductase n=1 Tax=Streptomyces sp. NPDC013178 TaxID=3155118 RepID=UPI0033FC51D1